MTEHLPECALREPCGADTPQHGFCSRQQTWCIHCERDCICVRLRACETRVAAAFHKVRADDEKQAERCARDQFDAGYSEAITQTMRRVQALRDPWPNIWPGLITRAETIAAIKEL